MSPCRECQAEVSEQALACPGCGAPHPAKAHWDGWGYEYKSAAKFLGWPLVHVSFKYRPTGRPVPARGILSIGQFGIGFVNISQFGIGVVSLSQFTLAGYALTQIGAAYSLIAQVGVYVETGYGQLVWSLSELLEYL